VTDAGVLVLGVLGLFACAFNMPQRLSRRIARAVAGVAVAVQLVALVLFLTISAVEYTPPVLLWIAVAWISFPLGMTVFGLAATLAGPPRVLRAATASFALFLMVALLFDAGLFIAPSALLMFIATIFALGANVRAAEAACEVAGG
jgi:hypothetical protein